MDEWSGARFKLAAAAVVPVLRGPLRQVAGHGGGRLECGGEGGAAVATRSCLVHLKI